MPIRENFLLDRYRRWAILAPACHPPCSAAPPWSNAHVCSAAKRHIAPGLSCRITPREKGSQGRDISQAPSAILFVSPLSYLHPSNILASFLLIHIFFARDRHPGAGKCQERQLALPGLAVFHQKYSSEKYQNQNRSGPRSHGLFVSIGDTKG